MVDMVKIAREKSLLQNHLINWILSLLIYPWWMLVGLVFSRFQCIYPTKGGQKKKRGQKRQSMSFSMNIPPKDKQGVSMTAMVTLYCNKSLRSHDIIIFQSYGLAKKE